MDTRLKVDLKQGFLEVEGSERLVREIYGDFKAQLSNLALEDIKQPKPRRRAKVETAPKTGKGRKRTLKTKETLTLVKDIDLSGVGKTQGSLKDFYASYVVSSNRERNLIFVYYLEEVVAVTNVTVNHVYTCYRDVGEKSPAVLSQSLVDTSFHKGWIDTSSLGSIKLTTVGRNYLEHDLPKAE